MAKHVIVGCAGLPHGVGWPRYFQRLPYLELTSLHAGPVRPSVLRRWRESAKHPRAFGVVAPAIITHTPGPRGYGPRGWPLPTGRAHEAGGFRATELVAQGVDALVAGLDALDAGVAVFRSPPDFTPSTGNREALRRFFGEVATAERLGDRTRVWHPSGLWDPPIAHAFARELGVLCGLDPLGADPEQRFAPFWASLTGEEAYYVVSGLGRSRRRTSNDHLEQLAELAARHDRAWVVFATTEPFPDAIRFSRVVTGHAEEAEALDDGPEGEADVHAADDGDEDA
jgi:uncharacterized protein YecE (DUF72 family)